MSKFETVPVITVYRLTDLFAAIKAQVAVYDAQLAGAPDWAQNHPPAASRIGLNNILAELQQWQNNGFDYAVTDAPFSDGNLTGNPGDSMIAQFGAVAFPQRRNDPCRVNPLKAGVIRAFGIDI